METLGERLKHERERLALSQPDFARACGVGKGSQINYEAGRRYPDAQYLSLAAALGVDVLWVVTGNRSRAEPLELVHESRLEHAPGQTLTLTVQEHALIDNYRHAGEQGRKAVEAAAAALARPDETMEGPIR